MSINHYRFKNQTYATYTVINKKKQQQLHAVVHTDILWCKTICFVYNIKLLWNHCKPRPQVAYRWRNIDYPNVSLWTQSLGAAQCALFLSLFSPSLYKSVSPYRLSSCKLWSSSTSWPNRELRGLFFLLFYDQTCSIPPGVHSPDFIDLRLFFKSVFGLCRRGWWSWRESRKPTTGERGGLWRCGIDDWTLWAVTQRTGAPRFLFMKYSDGNWS